MSATPPPFVPQPERPAPKPKGPNVLLLMLAVFGGFCCVGLIGFGMLVRQIAPSLASTGSCAMTMSFTKAAVREYVRTNGKYPDADQWQTQVEPHYPKIQEKVDRDLETKDSPVAGLFRLPPAGKPVTCTDGKVVTCVAFNQELSGKKEAEVTDRHTAMLFEVNSVAYNAHAKYDPSAPFKAPSVMGQQRERFVLPVGRSKGKGEIDELFDDEPDEPAAETPKAPAATQTPDK